MALQTYRHHSTRKGVSIEQTRMCQADLRESAKKC
jgi:hypothetical protein